MIECRRAKPEDALLLAATRRTVWHETYRGIYPDSMLDSYDLQAYALRDAGRIASSEHQYFLFMDEDVCIGYFSYGPDNYGPYKDFALCLNNLYILRAYRGRGLGRYAFAHIRQYCREQGIGKFYCGCNFHNHSARAFYVHMGGQPGDVPAFHENRSDDILHFEFCTGDSI